MAAAFMLDFPVPDNQFGNPFAEKIFPITISVAQAAPRHVARRTSRRVSRRTSVAGCSPYNAYYNCGGVYYAPVVEGGATVYIVVNT